MSKFGNPATIMTALALCIVLASSAVDQYAARENMGKSAEAQQAALTNSKKIEAQLDALAKGVDQLAKGGNTNAQGIVAVLKQNGVDIKGAR